MRTISPFGLVLALALAAPAVAAETGGAISETAMAGPYSVTLKVLPAESFTGPEAEMARDAGAPPVTLHGPIHPNHHMVAFVTRDGKPVEDATVTIRYHRIEPREAKWTALPVARMHVAGKSLATTHYGNNVRLEPGRYAVEISVNGSEPATILFTLPPPEPSQQARAGVGWR